MIDQAELDRLAGGDPEDAHRADTVDMSDDTVDTEAPIGLGPPVTDAAKPSILSFLVDFRAAGVKSMRFTEDRQSIAYVEFYELTDGERGQIEISKLSNTEQALYANMTEDEQAKALERHRQSLLYHSS
jgi:hypothetical protein